MDMPKPGDAHKKLSALVGEWSGDEKLHPAPWNPAGGEATARVTNRWIVDGFAVLQEYEQTRDGQVTFRGHGVFWFDPNSDEYVMHWWDSMGGTAGEYRGTFDGDKLTLGAPRPQGGQSRTSWLLTGPDAHAFLMEVSPDGESWHPAMEGQYQRRAARTAAPSAAKAAKTAKRVAKTAKATKRVAKGKRAATAASKTKRSAKAATPSKAAKRTGTRPGSKAAPSRRKMARRRR